MVRAQTVSHAPSGQIGNHVTCSGQIGNHAVAALVQQNKMFKRQSSIVLFFKEKVTFVKAYREML